MEGTAYTKIRMKFKMGQARSCRGLQAMLKS